MLHKVQKRLIPVNVLKIVQRAISLVKLSIEKLDRLIFVWVGHVKIRNLRFGKRRSLQVLNKATIQVIFPEEDAQKVVQVIQGMSKNYGTSCVGGYVFSDVVDNCLPQIFCRVEQGAERAEVFWVEAVKALNDWWVRVEHLGLQ